MSVTKRARKKCAVVKQGSPCEGCTVLSHSSASQKKGDLERLISLKLSSRPQSQPVCCHQPHTGPHPKKQNQIKRQNTQNIYRRVSHRAAEDLKAPDLQCTCSRGWAEMTGGWGGVEAGGAVGDEKSDFHLFHSCKRKIWKKIRDTYEGRPALFFMGFTRKCMCFCVLTF